MKKYIDILDEFLTLLFVENIALGKRETEQPKKTDRHIHLYVLLEKLTDLSVYNNYKDERFLKPITLELFIKNNSRCINFFQILETK